MSSKTATIKAVVLGDADDFKRSMTEVSTSAEEAGDSVKRDLNAGLDAVGEGAGGAEQKFMGLADSISGTQDVMGGLASGNITQVAMGMADLSGAVEALWSSVGKAVIGLWKKVSAMAAEAAATGTSTVAMIGHKIATVASEAATKAWAAAQWVLNAALNANPIVLVVVAIVALVAAAYLAYQHIGWFRDAVDAAGRWLRDELWPVLQDVGAFLGTVFVAAWDVASTSVGWLIDTGQALWSMFSDNVLPVLTTVGEFVVGAYVAYFKAGMTAVGWLIDAGQRLWSVLANDVFPILQTVAGWIGSYFLTQFNVAQLAIGWVRDAFVGVWQKAEEIKNLLTGTWDSVVGAVSGLGGRITSAAWGIWDGLRNGFRDAVNDIIGWWNNLSFGGIDVPFGPDIPGFGTPNIQYLAQGGLVRGGRGGTLAMLGEGPNDEIVVPLHRSGGAGGMGNTYNITVVAPVGSSPRDIGRELRRNLDQYGRGT